MTQRKQWQLGLTIFLATGGLISASNCAIAQSNIVPDNTLRSEPSSVTPNFNGLYRWNDRSSTACQKFCNID
ncbi:MAG: hypothetical protein HC866_09020 [Leptolyngbyaceae cyanobacterium RU_5_1]|nr:hypothetical protein [Leptolyngbyaceae cyanobacterium RU_5_1]